MQTRVAGLADILRLNTKLYRNCLDGMTDAQAIARPSGGTNSAAFIAAHLADSRYYLLRVLGVERENPLAPWLDKARGIDDLRECPSLAVSRAAWTDASHALRDRLDAITAPELDAPFRPKFATEQSVFALLTFLVQHDSYHIGQLALLRKYAGLSAMRYT